MNTHQNLLVIHLRCLFNIFNLHFYVYIVKQRCCQKHHWLRGTQIICEARAFFFFVWNVISMTNHSDIVARKLPLKSLWFCHGNSRDKIMAFIVLPLIHICEVDFFQSCQCKVQKIQWGTIQYMSSPRQHQELRLYFKDKHAEAVVGDLW